MSFYALELIYNNQSSKQFNVVITADTTDFFISKQTIELDKAGNGDEFDIVDIKEEDTLEFPIKIGSEKKLDRYEIDRIKQWLQPNDKEFHKLYILQDDMEGYYYNCRMSEIDGETIGNLPYLCTMKVICDSQYAKTNEQTFNKNISVSPTTFTFNNTSSTTLYPIYEFTGNAVDGNVEIRNNTTNKTIAFKEIKNGEVITIDTKNGMIISSLGLRTFPRLTTSPNFIELRQGVHSFTITGNVSNFKIKYIDKRKFGG